MTKFAFFATALSLSATVSAQTATQPAPAAQPSVSLSTQSDMLRAGTPVNLRNLREVTTKNKAARVGDRVQFEVAEDVKLNGVVVIPAGSPAVGELTTVRNKGMWGKSGLLQGRVLSVNANGRTVRMSGAFDDKGVTGTAGVVGAVALLPVAGFFLTGTSAVIPSGGIIKGFLDEDVQVSVAAPAAPTVATAPTTGTN